MSARTSLWRKLFFILYISLIFEEIGCKKTTFINVEHPIVSYVNPKFYKYFNLTTQRYGRRNPIYYVNVVFENVVPMDSKILTSFFFFELLTNQYKRSFIEVHHNWCDLIHKDIFFGAAMKQGKLKGPCPYKPDVYYLWNMTINPAIIPPGFPFSKGRIYCNITEAKTNVFVGSGHIDMSISQIDESKAPNLFLSN